MNVVVVESPAKAKTINKYLGSDYQVVASYGHVRDLPPKDGSVDPDNEFAMVWQTDAKSAKRLTDLAKMVKSADRLILATDPDREGEAISWHVLQVLKDKKALKDQPVERVVFNAITKQAVLDAMASPRAIEGDLVDAYRARRALDYLVGFNLSPVLWRKLPGARSAGRVQSVSLRLVCDREAEIERFKPQEYWSVITTLSTPGGDEFDARLATLDGKRVDRLGIKTEDEAQAVVGHLNDAAFRVASVEAKPQKRNPSPPFTTSTLQQEASRKLGFSSARTMQVAQRLYEGIDIGGETTGLITYMRTDGVQMAPEGISAIRKIVGTEYGDKFLPEKPRYYATKAKNAQEAHEAIRPTDVARKPSEMRKRLGNDEARLYDLIWKRAVASQMSSAEFERTTVDIDADRGGKTVGLRATGSVMVFEGFIKAYMEGADDVTDDDDDDNRLPAMRAEDKLDRKKVTPSQHFTEPPPRYTEATLIKKMEELGIGRPSTYTATLATLADREYVIIDKKRLVPGSKGRIVTAFLESFFEKYVEYSFTADLEEKLDAVSDGRIDWRVVLRDFWTDFSHQIAEVMEVRTTEVLDALNEDLAPLIFPARDDGSPPRECPLCKAGQLSLKNGRYGAFIGCSNYPECNFTRQLGEDPNAEAVDTGPKVLGLHPELQLEISLKTGRFGPYIEMPAEEGEKPRRASIPKGWKPEELTLEQAVSLIDLPREVGLHPESREPIQAGIGRYGPFLLHGGKYAKLESVEDVFEIGLNRAVTVIAESSDKSRFSRTPAALKALGDHPEGGAVNVREGRYGPYVNWGKINATLPKGTDPQAITLAEALPLLEAKAAKGGKKPAKKAAPKKAAAKKPAAKKTAKAAETKAAAKPKTAKAGTAKAAAKPPAKKASPAKAAPKDGDDAADDDDLPF
ncbi:type I DNA topoisomerase [Acuticoccus sp. MNP-M23]|uniref:type I DNA topoisomerase n=1 Tax=Acuticoccus sp. MNP-M23 TaxID=3072793 RepID=UPI00281612D9|nr:type I DNA topoisomerase [Acuticoccus sp. MNP-M23]WMS42731.1 type I DNA topoisomerase [Acuticoccus sp. MNP-M23]